MKMVTYLARFFCEGDCVEVFFVDFRLATFGDDVEHAYAMAVEAAEGWIWGELDRGAALPAPSSFADVGAEGDELILPVRVCADYEELSKRVVVVEPNSGGRWYREHEPIAV